MKKAKIQDISQNTLEELINLIWDINVKIGHYSHISQHLPKSLMKEIDKFDIVLKNENNNRTN